MLRKCEIEVEAEDVHGQMEVPKLQQRAGGKVAKARIAPCWRPTERATRRQLCSEAHGGGEDSSQLLVTWAESEESADWTPILALQHQKLGAKGPKKAIE